MTKGPLCFEELAIGDKWQSPGRTVTETDIVNFAGMTGDFDPIHIDHEYSRTTIYRRPIAHGLLGLSLLAGLSSRCPWMCNVAFTEIREWKFVKPIHVGDTVHVLTYVLRTEAKGRRSGRVIWRRQLINQDGVAVQEGILETVVATRHVQSRRDDSTSNSVPVPHRIDNKRTGQESPPPREMGGDLES